MKTWHLLTLGAFFNSIIFNLLLNIHYIWLESIVFGGILGWESEKILKWINRK